MSKSEINKKKAKNINPKKNANTELYSTEKRLMRITWNDNNWEKPSGHKWRAKDQGKNSVAHENQYGYGHEEWLFNSVFNVAGEQYGFIQGVDKMSTEVEIIDELYLFTIKPKTSERLLVAKIKNAKIIEGIDEEINFIQPYVVGNKKQMIEDLISVNAYYERFNELPHKPNVKFRLEDANFYTPPIAIPQLNQGENRYKYNRFQPYQIDESLYRVLTEKQDLASRFNFEAGKASTSFNYNKHTKSKSTTVTRTHSKITDALYEYLLNTKNKAEEKLSVEKTRIGGAIADVVVEENDNLYSIFEVKTKASAILNIREAIGQIFEYAFLDQSINIEKLVIVGPAACNSQELKYLEKLKSIINVKLEYWAFQDKNAVNKFIIQ